MTTHRTRHVMARIRRRLTYSNVMSTIACFLALGGTAQAIIIVGGKNSEFQLAKNSVGSSEIKNHAVAAKDLKQSYLLSNALVIAGNMSDQPVALVDGAGLTPVLTKSIIIHDKSGLLLLGQVVIEDQGNRMGDPASVQIQGLLDGSPVGTPQPHLIPDGFTNTVPIALFLDEVAPGTHEITLSVSVQASGPATASLASLNAIAMKE